MKKILAFSFFLLTILIVTDGLCTTVQTQETPVAGGMNMILYGVPSNPELISWVQVDQIIAMKTTGRNRGTFLMTEGPTTLFPGSWRKAIIDKFSGLGNIYFAPNRSLFIKWIIKEIVDHYPGCVKKVSIQRFFMNGVDSYYLPLGGVIFAQGYIFPCSGPKEKFTITYDYMHQDEQAGQDYDDGLEE